MLAEVVGEIIGVLYQDVVVVGVIPVDIGCIIALTDCP